MGSWLGKIFRGDEGPREPGPPLPGTAPRFLPGGEPQLYRGHRTVAGTDASGRRVFRSGIGFSTTSQAVADRAAEGEARLALEDALAGRESDAGTYAYFADRRAEPLVETLRGTTGESARITVNTYGSLVMNASSALFVDVDTHDGGPDPTAEPPPETLGDLLEDRPELAVRTYRTRGGWRYLFTNRLFDPVADETRSLLLDLEADPKYVLLCRVQRSFRARLTPKAWRAGQRPVPVSQTGGVGRDDLQRYVDTTWRYATARFVETLGRTETIAELASVVEYHDRWTQAVSSKPLA
jgi:hypothetical protein